MSDLNKKEKHIVRRSVIKYALALVLSGLFIAITIVTSNYSALISSVLDADTQKVENEGEQFYSSDYESYDAMKDSQVELSESIIEEGSVLLQNDGGLPLDSSIQDISLLGQNSVDPVYSGHGTGGVNVDKAVTLKDSFEDAGYNVNETLWDFYADGPGSDYRKEVVSVTGSGKYAVNEVPQDVYTSEATDSFAEYNDTGVVFLGRSSGENHDLPESTESDGEPYLRITQEERDLLSMAEDSFDNVVVVINSNNPMELGFIEDYDIDATLWVGGLGENGASAIGRLLSGEVNPSGSLVDTYAYNSLSAPSSENLGDYEITNSDVHQGNSYMVYGEGIYVGYRYYETRYEDVLLNQGNAGDFQYEDEVQFPFGYGLSYTDFEWSDFTTDEASDTFTFEVTVENTGDVAGKEVVQIYMQSPYTDYDKTHKVEKPSIELVGFEKTDELEPGETESVSIEVDKSMMKAYDANNQESYILDSGDYYFTAASDAHSALNNVLLEKDASLENDLVASPNQESTPDTDFVFHHNVEDFNAIDYSVSPSTEVDINNQFEDTSIHHYDDSYEYLSRSDWTGTWPEVYEDGSWEGPSELLSDLEFYRGDEVLNDSSATMPTMNESRDEEDPLMLVDLKGADYDDERWDTLIDRMSASQMTRLVRMGGYATIPIDEIGLPGTTARDGTAGFSDTLIPGRSGTAFPPPLSQAATWNKTILNEVGKSIGEDSLALDITGWYAPGVNIHRSPYSGRSFEYYSEDGYFSGIMAANVIKGTNEKGVMTYMKHFALNPQETNRIGGAMFANEQSIRSLYLKGFEIAAKEGEPSALMASMNRLGARWSGAHKGLMTNVLRDEWDYEGTVITDQAAVEAMLYQDHLSGLDAGTDMWLNTNSSYWSLSDYTDNETVMSNVRDATHNILYSVVNSNAMNGIDSDSEIIEITPWWQKVLYGADAVVFGGSLALVAFTTKDLIIYKKSQS